MLDGTSAAAGEPIAGAALGIEALFAANRSGPPIPLLHDIGALAGALVRAPGLPLRAGRRWAADLASIALGREKPSPPADRRYSDPAWTGNVLLRTIAQAHGMTECALKDLFDDLPLSDLERQRLNLVVGNVIAATSPANTLFNPAAVKAAVDQGAGNYLRGVRWLVHDVRRGRRVPPNTAPDAFRIGADVATTPGAVVLRTPVLELIHYRPAGDRVHTTPVLIAPSIINKFYLIDLMPGRSLVGHLLAEGYDVYAVSYVNPGLAERDQGLDSYVEAIVAALDAVRAISGSSTTHLSGICAGGTLASAVVGWLAAVGRQSEIASLSIPLAVLAPREFGLMGSLLDERTVEKAISRATRRGFVDGRDIGNSFAWLRPVDGVWTHVIRRYLLGEPPVPNELLFWVADQVNVAAALQRDLKPAVLDAALLHPGALTVLGRPIDLSQVIVPTYGLGGTGDYLTPWQGCLRSLTAMAGEARFVLTPGGHLSALLPAPGSRPLHYRAGPVRGGVVAWENDADSREGSWWNDWTAWLSSRSHSYRKVTGSLGSDAYPPGEPAPGVYVHRRIE